MAHQIKKNLGETLHRHGVEFRVWAPFAKSVVVVGTINHGQEVLLDSEEDGYWSILVKDAKPGQTYHYLIDTGKKTLVRNDPRARQLTVSDNGSSVIVGDDFDWGNSQFSAVTPNQQIIYGLHIGTFHRPDSSTSGTFSDAIEKLDYLHDLGVNMIELMPITSMASSQGWGYAPNYIFSVESAYGGRRGFMKFVRECHNRGIGVILDVVYNHFSSYTDLWQFDGWNENNRGGIYFYNDSRGDTPWGGRPDYGRPEVRQFILDNVVMWFNEYHLDGLRVDSTIYMRNTEGFNNDPAHDISDAWQLLGDITKLAHKLNPQSILIAEDCANNSYVTKSISDNGCGFDAQWENGFPHAIRDAFGLIPDSIPNIDNINHSITHSYSGNIFEKIIFSDSHDTAANGSVRLNEATSPGSAGSLRARQRILVASALTLTAPGIPMLLQGQEFMQQGAFNDWQALEWSKTERYRGIVLGHTHLIALRLNKYGNSAGLMGQSTNIFHQNDHDLVIGYHRWDKGGPGDDVIVIINFGESAYDDYQLTLPVTGTWRVRFNSSWHGYSQDFKETKIELITTDNIGKSSIPLSAYNVLILSQDLS